MDSVDIEHYTVLDSMQADVTEHLSLLLSIGDAWQPSDYLPDLAADDWREQVTAFKEASMGVSDEMLVVLVGDMVTEEALPNYAVSLNLLARDYEGDASSAWAKWLRGWTAEENRHGDLLNAYLRLTGRVDMRSIEVTVQHLIANGFNPKSYPDPYNGLIYTSFQERATRISHLNVGKIVKTQGDGNLAKICLRIAGDEARHEAFYTRIMSKVFDVDPCGAMLAFRAMLRTMIVMPGKLMYDGHDPDLFDHFAVIAQRTGVYTVADYAAIIDHLVKVWNVASRSVSGSAAKAQEYLCKQAERYGRLQVFPRLIAAEHHSEFADDDLSSGVDALDKLLGGGIPAGSSTLLLGPAGSGKSTVGMQFCVAAAARGKHAALYTFDETVHTLLRRARKLGMPLQKYMEAGLIMIQQVDPAELSPGEFAAQVRGAVEGTPNAEGSSGKSAQVIIIDSLNGYLHSMAGEKLLTSQLHELFTYLSQRGVLTLVTVAQSGMIGTMMHSPVDTTYLADNVILFRYFESFGHVRRAISVVKKRSGHHELTIRELTMSDKGLEVGPPLEDFQGVLMGVPNFHGSKKGLAEDGGGNGR